MDIRERYTKKANSLLGRLDEDTSEEMAWNIETRKGYAMVSSLTSEELADGQSFPTNGKEFNSKKEALQWVKSVQGPMDIIFVNGDTIQSIFD